MRKIVQAYPAIDVNKSGTSLRRREHFTTSLLPVPCYPERSPFTASGWNLYEVVFRTSMYPEHSSEKRTEYLSDDSWIAHWRSSGWGRSWAFVKLRKFNSRDFRSGNRLLDDGTAVVGSSPIFFAMRWILARVTSEVLQQCYSDIGEKISEGKLPNESPKVREGSQKRRRSFGWLKTFSLYSVKKKAYGLVPGIRFRCLQQYPFPGTWSQKRGVYILLGYYG